MKTRRMARIALQSGIYKAGMRQKLREAYERYFYDDPVVHPVQYPKSLGEVCLEEAQNAWLESFQHAGRPVGTFTFRMSWGPGEDRGITQEEWEKNIRQQAKLNIYVPTDTRVLRLALYHKEKT